MSTKRLNASPEVLTVLKGMTFAPQNGGYIGKINGQLDRKLYEQTNKFLEAMGGKWNRKAGGHIFPDDPRLMVEGLMDTGKLEVDNLDFFSTPTPVIAAMFDLAQQLHPGVFNADSGNFLEPSAGEGAIAEAIWSEGVVRQRIHVCELDDKRREKLIQRGYEVVGVDFLAYTGETYHAILMNPPFSGAKDIDHVQHAWDLLAPGGILVSVMADGATWTGDREKFRKFREFVDENGYRYPLPEHAFHESGTDVRACLVALFK